MDISDQLAGFESDTKKQEKGAYKLGFRFSAELVKFLLAPIWATGRADKDEARASVANQFA